MYPSKLSDDDLYDRYLDPTAYDNSCIPLDPHPPYLSSYDSPHGYPRPPQTSARRPSHVSTSFESETSELYLSDQIGVETGLHTIFGNRPQEQRAESNIPGSDQTLDPRELDSELYTFLKADTSGDAWYDYEPYPKPAKQSGDLSTTRNIAQDSRVKRKERLTCDFCDKQFTLQHDRLRHVRTLHRQEDDHVYRCAVPGCAKSDKIYNRLDNFKKHLKTTHRSEGLKEMVQKSRTSSGDTFTIMTPAMYSCN